MRLTRCQASRSRWVSRSCVFTEEGSGAPGLSAAISRRRFARPFNQRLYSLCNGRLKWRNATLAFSSITEWWFCWTTDAYSRLAWTRTLTSIWMSLPLQRALIGRYIKDRPGYEGSNQGNRPPERDGTRHCPLCHAANATASRSRFPCPDIGRHAGAKQELATNALEYPQKTAASLATGLTIGRSDASKQYLRQARVGRRR